MQQYRISQVWDLRPLTFPANQGVINARYRSLVDDGALQQHRMCSMVSSSWAQRGQADFEP